MSERVATGTVVERAYGRGTLPLALPVAADVIRPRHTAPLGDPAG